MTSLMIGTAIWWGPNLHVTVTKLEFDGKGEKCEEKLLQAESEHVCTGEREEKTLQVQKIS